MMLALLAIVATATEVVSNKKEDELQPLPRILCTFYCGLKLIGVVAVEAYTVASLSRCSIADSYDTISTKKPDPDHPPPKATNTTATAPPPGKLPSVHDDDVGSHSSFSVPYLFRSCRIH